METKARRRVALLYDCLAIKGGAGNVTVWLARALAAKGYEITLFTPSFDRSLWPGNLLSDFSVHLLPNFSTRLVIRRSSMLKRWMFGRYLSRVLEGYDVIVPNNNPSIQWVQMAKKLNSRLGTVLWLCQEPTRHLFGTITDRHFFEYEKYGNGNGYNKHVDEAVRQYKLAMQKKAKRRERNARWEIDATSVAETVIANSQFSARNIERVFSRKAEVIYPGITPMCNGRPARSEWPHQDYIGFVGRLSVRKNVENLVEAFRILCQIGVVNGLTLKIVGEGPQRSALERKICEYGLQGKISFLGQLSDDELAQFYANARLTVYIPLDEPFGLVPLESLYYGTPAIVSDHGGPAEILTHGENARMVNPFNPKEIAEGIARLVKNTDEARYYAENGRALVESSFTFERYVTQLERFF